MNQFGTRKTNEKWSCGRVLYSTGKNARLKKLLNEIDADLAVDVEQLVDYKCGNEVATNFNTSGSIVLGCCGMARKGYSFQSLSG